MAFRINLGGENEIAEILNQQPPWAIRSRWRTCRGLPRTLKDCVTQGMLLLICPNESLALPDECVDEVTTNSVPIDVTTWLGPGVQSAEIKRILKRGGQWLNNDQLVFTKS
jgi:hypothetical protein